MTTSLIRRAEIAGLLRDGLAHCNRCGQTKARDQFSDAEKGLPRSECKACVNARTSEWAKRPEVAKRKREAYELDRAVRLRWQRVRWGYVTGDFKRGKDPAKVKAAQARHYAKYREKVLARAATYRADKRELVNERARIWKAANPDKVRMRHAARYERIRATNDGSLTRAAVTALFNAAVECPYCGREFAAGLKKSLDHVIPLARGGAHSLANVVVCCWPCNSAKGARLAA